MPAPQPDHKPAIDVRKLSLAQLKMLADKGSRRARAELEGRMRAMSAEAAPHTPHAAPRMAPAAAAPARMSAAVAPASAPVATHRPMSAALPGAGVAAARPAARPGAVPAMPPMPAMASAGAKEGDDLEMQKLRLLAQQDNARTRAEGPPRLMGMVLMGWGALLGLGGLVMLASRFGGGFYAVCGLICIGVGWLLWRSSRLALYAHGAALVLMLGWAWHDAHGSFGLALVQAAPLWIAGLWMLVRPVREPLE
ncbi:MAG: hypothetical protein Q4D74_09475 [Comamonadaceae bacterium]|nr:hypothetical protein [Comamonadaceae bacterium]